MESKSPYELIKNEIVYKKDFCFCSLAVIKNDPKWDLVSSKKKKIKQRKSEGKTKEKNIEKRKKKKIIPARRMEASKAQMIVIKGLRSIDPKRFRSE